MTRGASTPDPEADPQLAWAPGRVNLIGDHTDTTGGLVLPLAIHLGTRITGRPSPGRLRLRSTRRDEELDVAWSEILEDDTGPPVGSWTRYPWAVARELATLLDHDRCGMDAVVESTVPLGAGLSSSAALEIATALALLRTAGSSGPEPATTSFDAITLATTCRRAEHRASGVPCGIMDPLVIADAREGAALLIDCTTLERTEVPLPEEVEILVTHVEPRALATSAYGDRTRDLGRVAEILGDLRDRDPGDAESLDDPVLRRRARHVITENRRVRHLADAFARGDLGRAGRLMTASHTSLRDDLEVSTPAVDDQVETWIRTPGVLGARLTGGGFGGCVVALARPGAIPPHRDVWRVRPGAGALGTASDG